MGMDTTLSTRDLRAFLALADTLSFSQAAHRLDISQSALSSWVAKFERVMGTRLFDRTTRTVMLTAAGQVLALHAREAIVDLERAMDTIRDAAPRLHGRVRIGASPILAQMILPRALRAFAKQYPQVKVSITEAAAERLSELLHETCLDLAVTGPDPASAELHYVNLTSERYVLVAAPEHVLGHQRGKVRLVETLVSDHIATPRGTDVRQIIDAAALQNGFAYQPFFEVNQLTTLGKMVEEGLGVAVLPRQTATLLFKQKEMVCRPLVGPVISQSIGVVWKANSPLDSSAKALLSLLKQQVCLRKRSL
jgi:LysR family carnitine catabolism transcriptional activator